MPTVTKIKRHDTAPAFTATLRDAAGVAVNLTGATARFLMRDPRTRTLKVNGAMTITDAAGGRVSYAWATGDTDTAAKYQVEVEVTFADSTIRTFPSDGHHDLHVVKDLNDS